MVPFLRFSFPSIIQLYLDFKIPESFAGCLGGLLSVVGQNLSLKLEVEGENSLSEVHTNREVKWTAQNKRYVRY